MKAKYLKTMGIGLLALALATGCGLKQGLEDASRTNVALKKELGLVAKTSWQKTNGHEHVRVRLLVPPPGDAEVAKREVAAVVMRTFRSKIESVDVEF